VLFKTRKLSLSPEEARPGRMGTGITESDAYLVSAGIHRLKLPRCGYDRGSRRWYSRIWS
jgi:hypothetical protein